MTRYFHHVIQFSQLVVAVLVSLAISDTLFYFLPDPSLLRIGLTFSIAFVLYLSSKFITMYFHESNHHQQQQQRTEAERFLIIQQRAFLQQQ